MRIQHFQRELITNSSGAATWKVGPISGRLISIGYRKDGTTPYTDTVDIAVTTTETNQTLWSEANVTASKQVAPRQPTHTNAGAAVVYASGGEPVRDHYVLADDYIQVVLAQGGDTKRGIFDVLVEM